MSKTEGWGAMIGEHALGLAHAGLDETGAVLVCDAVGCTTRPAHVCTDCQTLACPEHAVATIRADVDGQAFGTVVVCLECGRADEERGRRTREALRVWRLDRTSDSFAELAAAAAEAGDAYARLREYNARAAADYAASVEAAAKAPAEPHVPPVEGEADLADLVCADA